MNSRAGELIVYIALQSAGDRAFGATKLQAILFLIDFYAYGVWGKSITEATYVRRETGLLPRELPEVQTELEASGRVAVQTREYYGQPQKRLVALTEPDMTVFSERERRLIDDVIDDMQRLNSRQLRSWIQALRPWLAAKNGEEIPYSAVYALENTPVSREDLEWGERMLQELRDARLVP